MFKSASNGGTSSHAAVPVLLVAWVIAIDACVGVGRAEVYSISPGANEESVVKRIAAGDSIVLQDGTWRDADLKFERLAGAPNAPIRIRAKTPGKVVFTGATKFRVSGRHIVVSGFCFRDTHGVSDVVELRTHSERHAHDCRFTDCIFEQTVASNVDNESRWISVYGTNNRIDHCYFVGKRNGGSTLVVWIGETIERHLIDHNHFGPRPRLGRNGGETIRIGTSQTSEFTCQTTVEKNYFHKCNGEAEIVSNKSCEKIYRHNVFDQCSGALTLRHGHRCRVDGNVFWGRKQRGTGGVRIIGQGHSVTNNYFESLRGDAERAAICMMNGLPNGPLNSYAPVKDALVAHNTFVDCKVSIELAVGDGRQQTVIPAGCRIVNNLFESDKWALLRIHAQPSDFIWQGNKRHGRANEEQPYEFERVDPKLVRAVDGLLRPMTEEPLVTNVASDLSHDVDGEHRRGLPVAGCDQPGPRRYAWPSASNTGPTWHEPAR